MNELAVKDNINIEEMIHEVRGRKVILASDVAKLYQVETKRINEVVKRNIERFPNEFCFQLTVNEFNDLRSQIATSSEEKMINHGGIRYLPYVFTEHGIMMLSGLLRSDIAAQVNVAIINAFIELKKFVSNELLEQKYINNMVFKLDERLTLLESTFSNFKTFSNEIFFEGQIYDAHSLLLDIFNTSNKTITIIDNYISKELLDVLSKTTKKIIVYTKNIDKNLIDKYQAQYNNLSIKINNSFHDRFIIIDNKYLYHCGASFKDLGKKCFAITKAENKHILEELTKIL